MKIININDKNIITEVVKTLKLGGIIIFPTETCYGIGVDATNSQAVSAMLKIKKRKSGKPISIAVDSRESAEKYVEINKTASAIYKNFLPGPVTVISKSKHLTDSRLESENGNLGIRIPNYFLLIQILKAFNTPITASSANSAGGKTPYSISDILSGFSKAILKRVDLIIDAGTLPKNPPSTVIDTTTNDLTTYREGKFNPAVLNSKTFVSNSAEETISIGEQLVNEIKNNLAKNPILILLDGELGAGKTQFAKGIAKGLNITQIVKSPTYNYVNEYKFNNNTKMLYHLDAWRIQTYDDLEALRINEWFKNGNVIVIEWPSVIENIAPKYLKINPIFVEFVIEDFSKRKIRIAKIS